MEEFEAANNTQKFGTCIGSDHQNSCTRGEGGKPVELTVYNTYTKNDYYGDIVRANGERCKMCCDEKKKKRKQTVPAQFVAILVSNMASHQGETSEQCNAIVEKLMKQPCGRNCAHCGQFLSFVLNSNAKTRFCQASVDKKTSEGYTHPQQLNRLVCLFCQFCFASNASTRYAYEERANFQTDARSNIEKKAFDATASWTARAEANRNLFILEDDIPFSEAEMDKYLGSDNFMRSRYIVLDKKQVYGNMTIGDYKNLFREQWFRCMNTGKRLSLDPKSTWFASPDCIGHTGNYDNGNVQFTAYPLNLGKHTFDDVEFRECIEIR